MSKMSGHAVMVGWNRPVPGREAMANELFEQVVGFLGERQASHDIDSFDVALLTPNSGTMKGFFLIRGDAPKLDAMTRTSGWLELITLSDGVMLDLMVSNAHVGASVMEQMARWNAVNEKFAAKT